MTLLTRVLGTYDGDFDNRLSEILCGLFFLVTYALSQLNRTVCRKQESWQLQTHQCT